MKIWYRYFLKEFLKIFFLFLFCFYGLYVLIDYASHTSTFIHPSQFGWKEIVRYYLFIFASRAEILLPIALLIAFVKTMTTLNANHELIALMASGIKLKTLMHPFLSTSLCCVLLIYTNEQFFLPQGMKKLRQIEEKRKNQKSRSQLEISAQSLILEDGSLLVFQKYDPIKKQFFDAYWLLSTDKIYRIKYLFPFLDPPTGLFVDELVRQENGEILQERAHREFFFLNLKFHPHLLESTFVDPEAFSLSELIQELPLLSFEPDEKESKILTAFYWKLLLPWLCFIAIIAPAPYCIRFSRQFPLFLLYISSLFGLLSLYLFMEAAQVLGKRQVFSPLLSLFFPFLSFFTYFMWRFKKIDSY